MRIRKSVLAIVLLIVFFLILLLYILLRSERESDFLRFLASGKSRAVRSESFTFDVGL